MEGKKYTLTFKMNDGTEQSVDFFVPPGERGPQGQRGTDGAAGKDGYTPVKGKDYFTETDKADMVDEVLAALPVYNGEVIEL